MFGSQWEQSDGGLEQPDIQLAQHKSPWIWQTNNGNQYFLIESPNAISPTFFFFKQMTGGTWERVIKNTWLRRSQSVKHWSNKSHTHMKPEGHFSVARMSFAAEVKSRESPCDFAKYILSVSHSPLVISSSHRCTRTHPKATDFRQVWTAPFCYRVESSVYSM